MDEFPSIEVVTVTIVDGELEVDNTDGLTEDEVLLALIQATAIQADVVYAEAEDG